MGYSEDHLEENMMEDFYNPFRTRRELDNIPFKKGEEFTSKNSGTVSTIIEIASEDDLERYGLKGPAFWMRENGTFSSRLYTLTNFKKHFIIPGEPRENLFDVAKKNGVILEPGVRTKDLKQKSEKLDPIPTLDENGLSKSAAKKLRKKEKEAELLRKEEERLNSEMLYEKEIISSEWAKKNPRTNTWVRENLKPYFEDIDALINRLTAIKKVAKKSIIEHDEDDYEYPVSICYMRTETDTEYASRLLEYKEMVEEAEREAERKKIEKAEKAKAAKAKKLEQIKELEAKLKALKSSI
jgi:hypothetical protein